MYISLSAVTYVPYQCKMLISSVQSLSHIQIFVISWTAACQAFLSITISWNLLKLMSIESVTPSNHLILCRPLLLKGEDVNSRGIIEETLCECVCVCVGESVRTVGVYRNSLYFLLSISVNLKLLKYKVYELKDKSQLYYSLI